MSFHATTVDPGVFRRAVAIIDQPWATEIDHALTAPTGRPRAHTPSTILTLLAITTLETGEAILTQAANVSVRLSVQQKTRIGLEGSVDFRYISRTVKDIANALDPGIDADTGEISEPRLLTPPTELWSRIISGVIPSRFPATSTQAIDSTDIEVYSRRRSWSKDGRPDDDAGALPEESVALPDEKKRRSEPGWPKVGADGRFQNSIDPDARDGYRSGKNGAPKGVFIGFDDHLSVDVAPCGGEHVPALARGMSIAPAGDSKTDAGIALIEALQKLGVAVDEVAVDRGYSYGTTEKWAERLADCGVTQVFDLHTNQRGMSPGPDPRMIYIDGALFSAAIPAQQRKLPGFRIGMTADEKTELTGQYDDRAAYAFRPMGGPDLARRTQRYRGPALAGTVRCPNVPESMRLPVHRRPLTPCTPGEECGCGATVTLGPEDQLRSRQKHLYGTRKWNESYGRRNAVESANSLIHDTRAKLTRGAIRVRGLHKHGLLTALIVAGVNIALMYSVYGYDAGNPCEDSVTLVARVPKKQALHRKPRVFQRPHRGPRDKTEPAPTPGTLNGWESATS